MAETIKFLSYNGLQQYDGLVKAYVNSAIETGIATSFKGVSLTTDGKLQFWTELPFEGVENISPAYEITLPKEDLTPFMKLVEGAVEGNVASFGADGQVIDSGVKLADLATKAEVKEVSDALDALDAKVGQLPEGTTATSVIDYVNKKTEGIATDAALGELNAQVAGLQETVQNIKNDYLVEADKTELQGNIDGVDTKVDEVSGKVTTLVGEDANKSVRTIANEELAKQLIAEGAKESLDTLTEIAAWIQAHPDDAAAMNKAIDDLEALIGTLPEGITATTIVAYIQEVVAAEQARAEGVEAGFETRIKALEDKTGTGEGSVTEQIATAKEEAIAAAAEDATTKANTAEENAKKHADELNTAMNTRVEALEAIDHDHVNKAELDKFVDGDKAKLDDAAEKAHVHENAEELAKIVDGDVAKWNAAEQNAKDHTDTEIGKVNATIGEVAEGKTVVQMIADAQTEAETKVTELANGAVKANTDAIDAINNEETGILKQSKDYADAEVKELADGQVATNKADIATLREEMDAIEEISESEIKQLFGITE